MAAQSPFLMGNSEGGLGVSEKNVGGREDEMGNTRKLRLRKARTEPQPKGVG